MSEVELENNLGTIAKSGSELFKAKMSDDKTTAIIGQFGVGFYSSFMVSDEVEVISKAYNSDKAYKWTSSVLMDILLKSVTMKNVVLKLSFI